MSNDLEVADSPQSVMRTYSAENMRKLGSQTDLVSRLPRGLAPPPSQCDLLRIAVLESNQSRDKMCQPIARGVVSPGSQSKMVEQAEVYEMNEVNGR